MCHEIETLLAEQHLVAVLVNHECLKKLFSVYCFKIVKHRMNFRDLHQNELSSLPPGIFDKLTSLKRL